MIIEIADVRLQIAGNISQNNIAENYKTFSNVAKNKANIDINVNYENISRKNERQYCAFRASNWGIFEQNGHYLIPIFDDFMGVNPYVLIKSNKNFTDVQINIYTENISHPVKSNIYPLSFPQDELIYTNYLGKHKRGILIHAAGIIYDNKGYLFAGYSGAGKSTISKLFLQDGRATVLSDDRVVVRNINGTFYVYGTPWHGDAGICSNQGAPLKRIYFLEKGSTNTVEDLGINDKFNMLFKCGFMSFWDKQQMEYNVEFLDSLLSIIPSKIFSFLPDNNAIDYVLSL